ncbi:MAG TPA: hypothetical protein VGF60_18180 [Xanthobacteraceae bacterium]
MRILSFGLLLLASSFAAAADKVSDLDLRAAYCLAIAAAQEAKHQEELGRAAESGARDTLMLAVRLARERKAKLASYLAGKGLSPADDDSPVKAAQERGSQDVEACDRDIKLAPYKTCSDDCMARLRAADQRLICLAACPSPEACQRARKCLENFLR